IRDWDRTERLYARLEDLAEGEIAHVLAMKGRFESLVVFAERWGLEYLGLRLWAPVTDEPWCQLLELVLCAASVKDDPPVALSAEERNRLNDAAHHLAKALRTKP